MDSTSLLIKLLISGSLGLLMGIEREHLMQKEEKKMAAGLRTFTLVTLLGTLSSHVSIYFSWLLPLMLLGVILLNLISYLQTSKKSVGLTSEIAFLVAFLIGTLVYYGEEKISITFTILMVTLLSLGKVAHKFVSKIKYSELLDTLKFGIIALVILPFLPNRGIGPLNVFNPYSIWLMVVLVSGISYIGYVLMKVLGPEKGIKITGLVGGLASSTAVTSAMANKSKAIKKSISPLVFATTTAVSTMLLRVLVLVFLVNQILSISLVAPLLVMSLVGFLVSFLMLKKDGGKEDIELKSPFRMGPALKFGLIFTVMLFFSKAASTYLGSSGTYLVSLVSGLIDIDPISLSISEMVGNNISYTIARNSIFLAVIANISSKFIITILSGNKEYSKKVGLTLLLMVFSGSIVIFLM